MKLVTFYTKTHEKMLKDFLIPSITEDFEIVQGVGEQKSQDGGYFSVGFNESTKDKMIFLHKTLLESKENEVLLFSDVDIIFLKPIKNYINNYLNYDMVFQKGYDGLNTGFFVLKNTVDIRNLLLDVINNCHLYHDDQIALNSIIQRHPKIKYTNFDDKILSPAALIGYKVWEGEFLKIPEDTLVFHACWCAGVDNKIKLLDYVRNYGKVTS
jgi:hypothetical protein